MRYRFRDGALTFHSRIALHSDRIGWRRVLLLYDFIPLLHLSERDPQPCPHAIHQRSPVRNTKHQRRRIKEVCITRPLTQPQMVEQREEQGGVEVNEGCHDWIPKI
jgi:hypothetical protein